jgi:murein DD-endopeptidase MepM/ murein hydrolase activator NlpD
VLTACAVVGAFLLLLAMPASAESPPTTVDPAAKERADAAEASKKQHDAKAELDVLQATDEQLNGELVQIDDRLRQQQAAAREAESGRAEAESQVGQLDKQVEYAQLLATAARKAASERAINAYMRPDRETASQMLAAKDPQALGKMHVLVTNVAQYDHAVMNNRATAEFLLKVKQSQLAEEKAKAEELAQKAAADLQEVAELHDRRETVHEEVQHRISDLKGEVDALAAQQANLASIIAQREAEVATTTTTAPPTTVAPTTTTTAPSTTTTKPAPGQTAPPTTKAPATTAAPTTAPPTTSPPKKPPSTSLIWPVAGPINSPFGARWGTVHQGIDIGAASGVPIRAAAAGTVFYSGVMDGYGNVILIDHGKGMVTLYAHQSQLIAGVGATVAQGQTIGLVGSTGHSTGPHLHFEVRIGGVAYDPMAYLS